MIASNSRIRTPFVGRAREREQLRYHLGSGARLITIAGPSGMGKTRLAEEVCRELSHERRVSYCSLAHCETVADGQDAIARSLGITHRDDEALIEAIARKGALLLVLDNVDDLWRDLGPLLLRCLGGAPALQLLLTSILPLGIDQELRLDLGPLELSDAVELYTKRANQAWAGHLGSSTERDEVTPLVERLDRIPLAIELAASRVRILSAKAIISRFPDRFQLLRGDRGGRRGSLYEALHVTWELLPPSSRALLREASLFPRDFTAESAALLINSTVEDAEELLDELQRMAFAHSPRPGRFQLIESVRDFASLMRLETGAGDGPARALADHFVEAAERHAILLEEARAPASLQWLRLEKETLISLHRRYLELAPEVATRLGVALAPLQAREGIPRSEIELLDGTVRAARRLGQPLLLARALRFHAVAIRRQGSPEDAVSELKEALELSANAGCAREEARTLLELAVSRSLRGDFDGAAQRFDTALSLARENDHSYVAALVLLHYGGVEASRNDLEKAEALLSAALEIFEEIKRPERAIALGWLGGLLNHQGRFTEAKETLLRALSLARQLEETTLEARLLLSLGAVELTQGALDEAQARTEKAVALHRDLGNLSAEATATANLGVIALERGDAEAAIQLLEHATNLHLRNGNLRYFYEILPFLVAAEASIERKIETKGESLAAARAFFAEGGDRASLAMLDAVEGLIELEEARSLADAGRPLEALKIEEGVWGRLTSGPPPLKNDSLMIAWRLLRKKIVALRGMVSSPVPLKQSETAAIRAAGQALPEDGFLLEEEKVLLIGPGGGWFKFLGGERILLHRRQALCRILDRLTSLRIAEPGSRLSSFELFDIGWDDGDAHPELAVARVYTGVRTLRRLGLGDSLIHRDGGYLLAPTLRVMRSA